MVDPVSAALLCIHICEICRRYFMIHSQIGRARICTRTGLQPCRVGRHCYLPHRFFQSSDVLSREFHVSPSIHFALVRIELRDFMKRKGGLVLVRIWSSICDAAPRNHGNRLRTTASV